ncbi:hypothetical protein WICMUC_003223 [Wickerhamomyces mucosus]|uniref:Sec39 domain-containing protein n=1 Tax=Wickerhamomyces mucosus TaxID=1378264 RepID=A0A9P8PM20_9ASCO|nr:hypothetical protein WICMUC_003223 [Wickerhamomyces mucosus]
MGQDAEILLQLALMLSEGGPSKIESFLSQQNLNELNTHYVLALLLVQVDELQDPSDLVFVQNIINHNYSDSDTQDLNYITEKIIDLQIIDSDPELMYGKASYLRKILDQEANKFGFHFENSSLVSFVKARIRKTYLVNKDVDFNRPLISLVEHDADFKLWFETQSLPLQYYNKITNTEKLTFQDFEKYSHPQHINLIVSKLRNQFTGIVPDFAKYLLALKNNEILLYLREYRFDDEITFAIQISIIQIFLALSLAPQTLDMVYEIKLNDKTLSDILKTLQLYHQEYPQDESISKALLLTNIAINIGFRKNLKELDQISGDTNLQYQFMSNSLENVLNSHNLNSNTIDELFNLNKTLLKNIPSYEYSSFISKRLLALKKFEFIKSELISESDIISHYWFCFKNSSNGSKTRGEMYNALETLKLARNPSAKIEQLVKLTNTVDILSHYKLYFKPGQPFAPKDLLEVTQVGSIIQKILELNEDAYQNETELLQVSRSLSEGLVLNSLSELDLKILCIESALFTHEDFDFAFKESVALLNTRSAEELESKWFTFYQIGKHVPAIYIDGEVPENIIQDQLIVLSKILKIVPLSSSQLVIQQWNSLDLELSLRQPLYSSINNKNENNLRSLDSRLAKALTSTASNILNENSEHISKLFSDGLGWAIGRK